MWQALLMSDLFRNNRVIFTTNQLSNEQEPSRRRIVTYKEMLK